MEELKNAIEAALIKRYGKINSRGGVKTMIYINGIKATKSDLKRLSEDLKNGKQRAKAHTTKHGAFAITAEF